jgi:isopenicillin N synthase-like dioxygenase
MGFYAQKGSLTGLIPAMYLDLEGNIIECPDDQTGLYIQSRDGWIHHVSLPESSIGFQIGETSQIHTGGILQATPHAVRGSRSKGITRESFAVFMEPEFDGRMDLPTGKTVSDVQDASLVMPSSVRALASRWTQGMTFGEFSNATFKAFY